MSDAISDGYRPDGEQYRWANPTGSHGMAKITELEAAGWIKVREHWKYAGAWLMRKNREEAS